MADERPLTDADLHQDFRNLIQKLHQKEIDEGVAGARLSGKLENIENSLKSESEKTRVFVENKINVFEERYRQIEARVSILESWKEGISNKFVGAVVALIVGAVGFAINYAFTH